MDIGWWLEWAIGAAIGVFVTYVFGALCCITLIEIRDCFTQSSGQENSEDIQEADRIRCSNCGNPNKVRQIICEYCLTD